MELGVGVQTWHSHFHSHKSPGALCLFMVTTIITVGDKGQEAVVRALQSVAVLGCLGRFQVAAFRRAFPSNASLLHPAAT
jgi:hypothetical protein